MRHHVADRPSSTSVCPFSLLLLSRGAVAATKQSPIREICLPPRFVCGTDNLCPSAQRESPLAVKIQNIFMRRWAQADGIHFKDALVFDVLIQKVRREDAALQQELMIRFECIQDIGKGTGHLLDLFLLVSRQFIEIAILGFTWVDLVTYAVHARHQDR